MANYNCAFTVIDNFSAYHDLFYLLMVGSGVGVRVLKSDAEKLPPVRTDLEILHKSYAPLAPRDRLEYTDLTFSRDTATLAIGDSKEGWAQALTHYFDIITNREYRGLHRLVVIYDSIRPKGERLKTFGGTASGFGSMMAMIDKIHKVIAAAGSRSGTQWVSLKPIDLLDIANIIGENVVSGGVRRTSEIGLIDADDETCIQAKSHLYRQVNGRWEIDKTIAHRQMSNNSIFYREKPTREKLHWHLQQMRYSGEPGWINEIAGTKRRPNFNGCNPCGEILLDSHGLCNLTTLNVMGFVSEDGKLDRKALLEAQRLSARAGYRMTCRQLEMFSWNTVQQRDRLLGCSLTGWQDMVNATGMTRDEQIGLLEELRETAHKAAKDIALRLGGNVPLLVTTIKPEGTLSLLPTVSSGVHYSHSPYYIRRIRITAADPLCRVCEDLGYPVLPEVGQDPQDPTTKVVEFPVQAPSGRVKADVSAIEQLENYKMFMEHYVDHNCSITVHVRDNEWDEVEQWVWDNWDDVVALSFLSYDDSFYELMPYEAIDQAEYERRRAAMRPFNPSLLSRYEREETELALDRVLPGMRRRSLPDPVSFSIYAKNPELPIERAPDFFRIIPFILSFFRLLHNGLPLSGAQLCAFLDHLWSRAFSQHADRHLHAPFRTSFFPFFLQSSLKSFTHIDALLPFPSRLFQFLLQRLRGSCDSSCCACRHHSTDCRVSGILLPAF